MATSRKIERKEEEGDGKRGTGREGREERGAKRVGAVRLFYHTLG